MFKSRRRREESRDPGIAVYVGNNLKLSVDSTKKTGFDGKTFKTCFSNMTIPYLSGKQREIASSKVEIK